MIFVLFLEAIDQLHSESRKSYRIPAKNKNFSCYIPIEIQAGGESFHFEIWKREKAKLLLLVGKQKVYLSDAMIISTILEMEDGDIKWFLNQFISLYSGKGAPFRLIIDDQPYSGKGIETYPQKKKLYLFSDSLTDYQFFSVLLSFIFCKDSCWGELTSSEDFGRKTLCKYISIIDYYHNHAERSKSFLEAIGYPVQNKYPIESKHVKAIFDDLDNVKKFDISQYV